jgi:hypothetical protein
VHPDKVLDFDGDEAANVNHDDHQNDPQSAANEAFHELQQALDRVLKAKKGRSSGGADSSSGRNNDRYSHNDNHHDSSGARTFSRRQASSSYAAQYQEAKRKNAEEQRKGGVHRAREVVEENADQNDWGEWGKDKGGDHDDYGDWDHGDDGWGNYEDAGGREEEVESRDDTHENDWGGRWEGQEGDANDNQWRESDCGEGRTREGGRSREEKAKQNTNSRSNGQSSRSDVSKPKPFGRYDQNLYGHESQYSEKVVVKNVHNLEKSEAELAEDGVKVIREEVGGRIRLKDDGTSKQRVLRDKDNHTSSTTTTKPTPPSTAITASKPSSKTSTTTSVESDRLSQKKASPMANGPSESQKPDPSTTTTSTTTYNYRNNILQYKKSDGTTINRSEQLDKHFFGTQFGSDQLDFREHPGVNATRQEDGDQMVWYCLDCERESRRERAKILGLDIDDEEIISKLASSSVCCRLKPNKHTCLCGHKLKDHLDPNISGGGGNGSANKMLTDGPGQKMIGNGTGTSKELAVSKKNNYSGNNSTAPKHPFRCRCTARGTTCNCKGFQLHVQQGAWEVRCRCKHKRIEHALDAKSGRFLCCKDIPGKKGTPCDCKGFEGAWVREY